MEFSITTIQFFPNSFTEAVSETEVRTIRTYSANIAINDKFIIRLSGDEESCEWSIPAGDEMAWNDKEGQDWACENVDEDELVAWLESEGVENNYFWLEQNADETY